MDKCTFTKLSKHKENVKHYLKNNIKKIRSDLLVQSHQMY